MPVIHIEYDKSVLLESDVQLLCKGAHEVTVQVTGVADVPVYANSSHATYAIAPIEIFIRLSDHKITDKIALSNELKMAAIKWKADNNFSHNINMSLIPMD